MGYMAILVPQKTKPEDSTDNRGLVEKLTGKLISGVTTGDLKFDDLTSTMKSTAKLIVDSKDELLNKFAGIALTQLLEKGKISNETAFGYLTQGFPKALGMASVALGFASVEQLKTALKAKNGVNVQQFIKAFENAGTSLKNLSEGEKTRENVEGFNVIEIDAVLSDSRNYVSETPDRRVQSGQTYQEYVHNMPDIINLECILQNGRNYTGDDFEEIIRNLRDRKIAVTLILGETRKEEMVLTSFNPIKGTADGYEYSLEFKRINVGTVELVPLTTRTFSTVKKITNKLLPKDTKTVEEKSNGFKKAIDETKEAIGKAWTGIKAGFKMGWGIK